MLKAIPGNTQPIPMMIGHLENARHSLNNMKQMCRLLTNSTLSQSLLPHLETFGQKIALLKGNLQAAYTTTITPHVTTQLPTLAEGVANEVYALYTWVIQATLPENEHEADLIHEELSNLEELIANEGTPVYRTISALQELKKEALESLMLLHSASFLEMEDIPYDLLLKENETHSQFKRRLQALEDYGLIHTGRLENTLSIHPIAHGIVQKFCSTEEQEACLAARYAQFDKVWPFEKEYKTTWQATRRLLPHLMHLIRSTPQQSPLLTNVAEYLNDIGLYWSIAEKNFYNSTLCHLHALSIRRSIFGSSHPAVADSLINLGMVLQAQRDFEGANKCFEQALEIYLNQNEAGYLGIGTAYNCLGTLLVEATPTERSLSTAAEYHIKALHSLSAFHRTETHVDVAKTYANLGNVRLIQSNLEGAKSCYEKALDIYTTYYHIDEELSEDELPEDEMELTELELAVLFNLNSNFGDVLQKLGQFESAKKCYEKVLDIGIDLYGADSSPLLRTYIDLVNLCNSLQDFGQAQDYLTKARQISYRIYGNRDDQFFNHLIASIGQQPVDI